MSPEKLRAHVAELAEPFKAVIRLPDEPGDCDESSPDGHVYAFEPIDVKEFMRTPVYLLFLTCEPGASPGAYLTALHELGHLYTGLAPRGWWRRQPKLQAEARAWRWALDNSLIDPSPEEWWRILVAVCSHALDQRNKRTPEFQDLLDEAAKGANGYEPG